VARIASVSRLAGLAGLARRTGALLAAVVLGALIPVSADAQSYPRLHIVALAQRSDRAAVEPNGAFHVTIHVKIRERRDRLDELILGSFEDCEIISNETVRTALPDGTDFVERLTVQALAPGVARISPAYIDAVDPARGQPMRYSSNALRIEVTGAGPIATTLGSLGDVFRRLFLAAFIVACLFAAVFVLGVLFVRRGRRRVKRRAPAIAAPAVVACATPAAPADGHALAQAAAAYRSDRSEQSLAQVRAALFGLAGAAPGATLIDALGALGERDAHLRAALLDAERAAFGPAAERGAAGDAIADAWTR
jgi:hypothetical protein